MQGLQEFHRMVRLISGYSKGTPSRGGEQDGDTEFQ